MNIELLFSISNLVVMPFWLLMIFVPFWSWTERIMRTYWPIVPPAVIYVILIFAGPGAENVLGDLMNPTAGVVAQLLGNPAGAATGWAHFLAFDLFVGRFIYLNARQTGMVWWLSSPILFFTLMLGPIGFLLWFVVLLFGGANLEAQASVSG